MKATVLAVIALVFSLMPGLPAYADSAESVPMNSAAVAGDLVAIVNEFTPISRETKLRRNIAQASFCLPQNILGRLLYGILQLTGSVVETAVLNEAKVIVAKAPVGVSLGRYILIHESLVTENIVRHEYGHVLQGYKHGPFYLLLEGVVSLVQVTLSMISPSFADGYYDRWPENEANELGEAARAVVPGN